MDQRSDSFRQPTSIVVATPRLRRVLQCGGCVLLALGLGVVGMLCASGPALPGGPPVAGVVEVAGFVPLAGLGAALVAVGLATGLLAGMLGIGGSLVTLPALYLLLPAFGVARVEVPHVAVATSLATMVPTASAAAWSQYRRGALHLGWMRRLAAAMAAGAIAGVALALVLGGPVLAMLFAAQALAYGWALLRPPQRAAVSGAVAGLGARLGRWPPSIVGFAFAGLSACAGMGAATLTVPYLQAQGLALRSASATAGALSLAMAIAASSAFVALGLRGGPVVAPCWPAALLLGSAAVVAAPAGVALAHRVSAAAFRVVLGSVILAGASTLVLRTVVS